jgi:dTDP-4-amino-4,6-dideoxygalactose transaminase
MVITQSFELADKMRSLRDHGATKSDLQRHEDSYGFLMPEYPVVGFNYRMTDFQGALGIAQIKKLDDILNHRRALAKRYDQAFNNLSWLAPPITPEGYIHGYQSYVCLYQPQSPSLDNVIELNKKRNEFMFELDQKGIATRQGTQAVHTLAFYKNKYNLNPEDYPNTYLADKLSMALPLYAQMTEDEQDYVIEHIKQGQ